MAKLIWPPEKTFKYVFDEKLEMEIPAINNNRNVKNNSNTNINNIDRDYH